METEGQRLIPTQDNNDTGKSHVASLMKTALFLG